MRLETFFFDKESFKINIEILLHCKETIIRLKNVMFIIVY